MERQQTVNLGFFTEDDLNLLMYGVEVCEHCGEEIFLNLGACLNNCHLSHQRGDKLYKYYREPNQLPHTRRRLNVNEQMRRMMDAKINWDGIDILELYDEYGTFTAIADMLGISRQSVSRRYHEVKEPNIEKNKFYY